MAIQISGTTVINNSRQLQNIASLDSTTTATIGAAAGGGATHLTTFSPSYAASNTISNLNLSGYNFLRVELNGLGLDVNGRYLYMAHNSDRGQCLYSFTNNTAYGAFARGDVNLATGYGYFSTSKTIRFSDGANYSVTANASGGLDLGITNSTTSITFYAHSGSWMQAKGTIRLYGYD